MAADEKWRKAFGRTTGDGFVMALEYAGLVVIFLVIGWLLDRAFNATPWFVVIFAILGFIGGFLRLMFADRYDEARRVFRGLDPKPQREAPDVLSRESEEGGRDIFDTKTGLTSFKDWKPRKYGDAVPDELKKDDQADEVSAEDEAAAEADTAEASTADESESKPEAGDDDK